MVGGTLTGTHEGEVMGAAATGNRVEVEVIVILRFDDSGKIAERWSQLDALAFLAQLGLMPEAAAAQA